VEKRPNVHLLVVDPQNDFCDLAGAALPIPGATADMERLAALINQVGHKLKAIHVTLDSHRLIDIAHPAWWRDQNGQKPKPFTMISAGDIEVGIWTPRNPAFRTRTLQYAHDLESAPDHYKIFVWPPHCLIGTWGHNVHAALNDALQKWSDEQYVLVDYMTKGTNPCTEHYGALMAEVPDPNDPSTGLNTAFLNTLIEADIVLVAGEASSHCVLKTVKQIAANIADQQLKKFHLLRDCMSPVPAQPGGPDFPKIAQAFFHDMKDQGMTITTSTDFLA
jgi:nicotinamidase-related amidase